MRISDWSSDVCSADLGGRRRCPRLTERPCEPMKITIDRAALLKPLAHVQSVVERRNTIPILANVLVRAADGTLSLTATDMDLDVVESVACSVEQAGQTTVPAHTLYEIVRKLPDGAERS